RRFTSTGLAAISSITKSDATGGFGLELEPGNYLIEARDANNAPGAAIVGVVGGDTVSATLTMVPGGSVGGRVVDRKGTPVAGAFVTVQGEIPVGSTVPRVQEPATIQVSENGVFTLRPLRPGPLRLTARLAGFRDSVSAVVFLPLAGRIDNVML